MIDISRNDPCHCGSGKKYKKCCLEKDESENLKTAALAEDPPDEEYDEFEGSPDFPKIPRDELTGDIDDADDDDEEEEEEEEEGQADRERPSKKCPVFPKPPKKLPDLPPEQDRIVEKWWKAMIPIYKKRVLRENGSF